MWCTSRSPPPPKVDKVQHTSTRKEAAVHILQAINLASNQYHLKLFLQGKPGKEIPSRSTVTGATNNNYNNFKI